MCKQNITRSLNIPITSDANTISFFVVSEKKNWWEDFGECPGGAGVCEYVRGRREGDM